VLGPAADDEPITADEAGHSGGWRYDAESRTWTFGWSTRPLAPGCYRIQVTTPGPEYPSPSVFPVALWDR
jgi:hypothetical protein